jgi:outer membrane protein OmpA-like peptidoglycan-associated protein
LVLLGFALAGLVGSIITAWLLLPNLIDGSSLEVSLFEDTSRATLKPPAAAQVESDETPVAPGLADDTDARPDEENKRPQVNTDAALAIKQIPAGPSASNASTPDIGASDTGAVGVASSGDPAPQFPTRQQTTEEQVLVHQADLGLTTEEEEGPPPVEEKNETLDVGDSATATPFQVDPAQPGVQSAGGDAQRDAGPERTVDKVASLEQAVDKVASDCAPLFPIKFKRADVRPQVADLKQKTERLAAWLNANPTATLSLDGHADASGPEEYNLLISFRRATAVAALLEEAGASKKQLVVRAYGEGQSSSRSANAALERRVALTVDAGEPCDEPSLKGGALR